jgi:hypothetical protein
LLSRGAASTDSTARVELTVVPIASGPLTVAALKDHGIDADGQETFNVATSLLSDFRITVPRGQLSAAQQVLGTLG